MKFIKIKTTFVSKMHSIFKQDLTNGQFSATIIFMDDLENTILSSGSIIKCYFTKTDIERHFNVLRHKLEEFVSFSNNTYKYQIYIRTESKQFNKIPKLNNTMIK